MYLTLLRIKAIAIAAVSAALALLLLSCGTAGGKMDSTMTLQAANEKLESYIFKTMQQFPDEAKLEEQLVQRGKECQDPNTRESDGKKNADRIYFINNTDPAKNKKYFDMIREWWIKNNFKILDNEDKYEYLWVEDKDGFRLTLEANSKGELSLAGSSPCVWPDGKPVE